MLIDVAISGDRNVIKKDAEKILKYKDLTIEIQRMWNVKTKVISVITGATGAISESFKKYVSNIPGNHKVVISLDTLHKEGTKDYYYYYCWRRRRRRRRRR
jgi:hypothetical protein